MIPIFKKTGKYRSKFEARVAQQLASKGASFGYESKKIGYLKPETPCNYTPDFILDNGILLEAKGLFTAKDRQKMVLVRDQNPSLDLRLVLMRPTSRLYKGSKTTYANWADKNKFKWCGESIPDEWLKQSKN